MANVPLIQNPSSGFSMRSVSPTATIITGNFRVWNNWTNGQILNDGYNINSNFDTSNGRYTAPVSGRYLVTMTLKNSTSNRRRIGHILFSNNTYTEFVESYDEFADIGNSTVIQLTAGQWIQFGDHNGASLGAEEILASVYFLGV